MHVTRQTSQILLTMDEALNLEVMEGSIISPQASCAAVYLNLTTDIYAIAM